MYTSCGWFFDDISGIETVQIMQYAGRALQLAKAFFSADLENTFVEKLALAPGNIPENADGAKIYETRIKPAAVSLAEVGGHYAISSLFKTYGEQSHLYCYTVHRLAYKLNQAGQAKLAAGRFRVHSSVTWESAEFVFAVIHFGDHNISCGLASVEEAKAYKKMQKEVFSVFDQADFPAVIQKLGHFFNTPLYSMKSLFGDDQRGILEPIIKSRIDDAISLYKAVYEPNVPLMRFLTGTNSLMPRALAVAGELVLNHRLRQEMVKERLDHEQIRQMMEQARLARIPLNETTLEYTLRNNIEGQVERFENHPTQYEVLDDLAAAVELVYALPFHVVLRKAQNTYFSVDRKFREDHSHRSEQGDPDAVKWLDRFNHLGDMLLVRPWTGWENGG